MINRLLGRAAISSNPRVDDNIGTIKKRIEIFRLKNKEILEHYEGKVIKVNSEIGRFFYLS
jgi:adenylate kinase family enzyme